MRATIIFCWTYWLIAAGSRMLRLKALRLGNISATSCPFTANEILQLSSLASSTSMGVCLLKLPISLIKKLAVLPGASAAGLRSKLRDCF